MTPHMKLDEKAVEAAAMVISPNCCWPDAPNAHMARRQEIARQKATAAIEAYLSAAHAPQGGVRGEPPAAVVDALNRHFATIGVTTKMPSVLAYDVWNIIRAALTGSDPQPAPSPVTAPRPATHHVHEHGDITVASRWFAGDE